MCARIIPALFFGFASGMKIPLQKAYYKESTESEKMLEVLMRTIGHNFSFFFTPKNILVIHLFIGQLSAWSFPGLVLLFQNLQSGGPTHLGRLAHWKPFQEMMWWCFLLQLWLCLYFWLNSHWTPALFAIVFLYLLWFRVVCTSLLRPGHVLCSVHKDNYYMFPCFA